jgi:hypothetical protein
LTCHEERLRRLVLHDERCIQSMLAIHLSDDEAVGLDTNARALVRLGALVALGGSCFSYHWALERSQWRRSVGSPA